VDVSSLAAWVEMAMGWPITNRRVTASVLNWEQSRRKVVQVCGIHYLVEFFLIPSVDIYCYICNDAKLDPDLAMHLSTFGINVQTLTKTEKSMTELVIPFFIFIIWPLSEHHFPANRA